MQALNLHVRTLQIILNLTTTNNRSRSSITYNYIIYKITVTKRVFFYFEKASAGDVYQIIWNINSVKANDPDTIRTIIIKLLASFIDSHLTWIFNQVISSNAFSETAKFALIRSIFLR